jgi:hypothetical protein
LHEQIMPAAFVSEMCENPRRGAHQNGYSCVKLGIFGEFDTIEESLVTADEGLKYSVERLSQF